MATELTMDLPGAQAEPAAPAKSRRGPLLVAAVLLLALGGWGVRRYTWYLHHVSTDNAQLDGHITVIAPKVQAFISRVLVDDNQQVRAGDTLVVLDDRDLRARLQQAEADLATAEALVGSSRKAGQAGAQLAWSEAQAASAQATIASAEAAYRKALADLVRTRTLAEQKIVPAQQLDAAQAAADVAVANLEAARKQAAAAGSQVSAYGAALSGAGSRLASARAALETARLQLSYASIVAPVDGVVAKRSAENGALIQVGQSLMAIVPEREVWVTANLKETQLAKVRVGDAAEFEVDAYPGRRFTGHVESVSPATGARFALLPPDNATGNFTKVVQRVPVRIAVDGDPDPARPLRPGMSVVVDITTR